MTDLEDNIRRSMAEHDDEAPRAADLLRGLGERPPPRSHRHRWYVSVAAAVVVILVAVVWAGGLFDRDQVDQEVTTAPPSPLSCPGTYVGEAPWVPAEPSGADGSDRLVPEATPDTALVCAYAGNNTDQVQSGWALSGQRSLSGGLAALAAELTWQPRKLPGQEIACAGVGGAQTNYLMGLEYGNQTIWVAASDGSGGCPGMTNGEFASSNSVGRDVTEAFESRVWPEPRSTSCDTGGGRLGQEDAMVPAGLASLIICAPGAHMITSDRESLVSALNALPTKQSTRGCGPSPKESARTYKLVFGYPVGPPVAIYVAEGCFPEVDNLGLQSERADTVLPLIEDLMAAN